MLIIKIIKKKKTLYIVSSSCAVFAENTTRKMVQVRSKSMPTLQTVLYREAWDSIADTSCLHAPKPAQVKFARVKTFAHKIRWSQSIFIQYSAKRHLRKKRGSGIFQGIHPSSEHVSNGDLIFWPAIVSFGQVVWQRDILLHSHVMWPYMFILSSTHLLLTCFKSV
jgi:hypothetical protein